MKKFVVSMLLLVVATTMMASDDAYQAFGVQIGYSSPIFRLNEPAEIQEDKSKLTNTILNGLKVGVVFECNYVKGFGSLIGLNYSYGVNNSSWRRLSDRQSFEYPRTKTRTEDHIMELFVDWQYKFEIAQNTYVILYTGPTIQAHLSLMETQFVQSSMDDKDVTQKKISSFNYDDGEMMRDFNRLNVLWGLGLGFQYDRYFLRGGYDFGLMNPYKITNFSQAGYTDRNTRGRLDGWQIKLGVYLWEKK